MGNQDASYQLEVIAGTLTAIAGRILQTSDRKAAVVLGTATKVIVGAAAATSTTGIVGSLGIASTGAAIAGLSGAAKTTATMYWIGGLVGGGVAAGGLVLGAGALGAGIYGSIRARRAVFGAARPEQALSEREMRILEAIHALTATIRTVVSGEREVTGREFALFSRIGVTPLLDDIDAGLAAGVFCDLKLYHRVRLRGHVNNLRSGLERMGSA